MDATSGANALIVNDSRFRGSQVIQNGHTLQQQGVTR